MSPFSPVTRSFDFSRKASNLVYYKKFPKFYVLATDLKPVNMPVGRMWLQAVGLRPR